MEVVISIGIGIIIVFIALNLIKKEVKKASFFKHVQRPEGRLGGDSSLIAQIQVMEQTIDDMNQSFYEIVNDLEGHYSGHEKEIEIMNEKLIKLQESVDDLTRSIYYQNKRLKESSSERKVETSIPEEPNISNTGSAKDHAYKEAIRLRALGYDDQEIAKRMHKGVREIKMLLSIKK